MTFSDDTSTAPAATGEQQATPHEPPEIVIETGPSPQASIILLHGLGSSADEMVELAEGLATSVAGAVRLILPQAPRRPILMNGGFNMSAWYDVGGGELAGFDDEAGMRASQSHIDALIEREQQRGVPSNRIILGGFSQGGVMALYAGLRCSRPLAGIIGLSCYLPAMRKTAFERNIANNWTPIFISYGTLDAIVPPPRIVPALALLTVLGYDVEWHEYMREHTITAAEVKDLNVWINRHLSIRA